MEAYAAPEWIDIVGELPPEAADLAKAIRQLWKENEYLYAVRASKVLFRAEGESKRSCAGSGPEDPDRGSSKSSWLVAQTCWPSSAKPKT